MAGLPAKPERRVCRERKYMRNKITHYIHYLDTYFAIWQSNMNMQPENKIGPCGLLYFFYNFPVTGVICNCYFIPVSERVRSCGGNSEAVFSCQLSNICPKACYFSPCFIYIPATLCSHLNYRSVHFGFYLFFQKNLP